MEKTKKYREYESNKLNLILDMYISDMVEMRRVELLSVNAAP